MARPTKIGLDYFPLNTKLDIKLKLLKANHGHKGYGLLIRLFQEIYSDGYYIEWNDDIESLFKSEEGFAIDDGFVSSIIEYCLNKEIFNKNLYKKFGILTSKGIQERYVEAKTGRIYMDKRYFLLKYEEIEVNAELIEVNSKTTIVFTETMTQRKEKGSKEDKNKEEERKPLLCSWLKFNAIKSKVEMEFNKKMTSTEYDKFKNICSMYVIDLIECALRECLINDVKNIDYLFKILMRFEAEGITAEKYYEENGNV